MTKIPNWVRDTVMASGLVQHRLRDDKYLHKLEYEISRVIRKYGLTGEIMELPNGLPLIVIEPTFHEREISIDEHLKKGKYRLIRSFKRKESVR